MGPQVKRMKLIDAMDPGKCETSMHTALNIPEIRAEIFGYLNLEEKGRAALVCKKWRNTCNQLSLWTGALCKLHQGYPIPTDILKRRRVRKYELVNMDSTSIRSTLTELVKCCPDMQSLQFNDGFGLIDDILQDILPPSGLIGMTTLGLNFCMQLTDVGMEVITRTMPSLKSLDLGFSRLLSDTSLLYIAERLPQLTHLNLSNCSFVTANGIGYLAGHNLPNAAHLAILDLNLFDCQGVTDDALLHLSTMAGLQNFNLSFCKNFSDDGIAHLARITSLKVLLLTCCEGVTDVGLAHLAGMPNLKTLELAFCAGVTDIGLVHLARVSTSLQELNLTSCRNISEVGISSLVTGKPNITHLTISQCSGIGREELELILSGMHKLKSIRMDRSHITSDGLCLVQRCHPHLCHISFHGPNDVWLRSSVATAGCP